jgi:hypothetical protein
MRYRFLELKKLVSLDSDYTTERMGVLVTGFLAAEDIVDVKDIIAILIIISVVLDTFARLGQYSPRVP